MIPAYNIHMGRALTLQTQLQGSLITSLSSSHVDIAGIRIQGHCIVNEVLLALEDLFCCFHSPIWDSINGGTFVVVDFISSPFHMIPIIPPFIEPKKTLTFIAASERIFIGHHGYSRVYTRIGEDVKRE